MEFRDLKKQYVFMQKEIDEGIAGVIRNSNFISGKPIAELENQLAEYVGVKHCITCANGTDALNLALMVWKIGKGNAVFVPDFTFFASGEVISYHGATPIFVDVNVETYNIDCRDLERKIKKILAEGQLYPRAIVAVDLFGQPADYDAIKPIAQKYGLRILEDAAQGFGGQIRNKMAGSFGDISTTSFFPAKPLGCYGDGGAIFTDHDEWATVLRSLCVHGKGSGKYDNVRIGVNSRLDTMQAAILLPKLSAFRSFERDKVNELAARYSRKLANIVKVPVVKEDFTSSWAQYTVQLKDKEMRNALQIYLKQHSIPSMVYYPKPMHLQKAFQMEQDIVENYLTTETLCDTVLSLPIHPYMEETEQDIVIDAIFDFFADYSCAQK